MDQEPAAHRVDRTGWRDGPWSSEPDRVEWRAHGLACLIVRNDSGALCGYVGVPPGHPWHGRDYCDDELDGVEVHGGLTYASPCSGPICHVARAGEPADVWWLGFDCIHAGDYAPGLHRWKADGPPPPEWVRAEVERLALQCARAGRP